MPYIPTSAYEPGFPLEWEGLDLASAEAATPRLYGVSSGNGNDGVSHTFPDYYVRTCDPWTLARAAIVAWFEPDFKEWAVENSEIDGEAAYTIYATILDPPDDENEIDHSACEAGEDCEGCPCCEDYGSWSDTNGAWLIYEVFPVDSESEGINQSATRYDSLTEAFSVDLLELVKEY